MNFKALRTKKGLTQAELADRAGISISLVQKIEVGNRRPGMRNALALAKALGTTPQKLAEVIK